MKNKTLARREQRVRLEAYRVTQVKRHVLVVEFDLPCHTHDLVAGLLLIHEAKHPCLVHGNGGMEDALNLGVRI